MHHTPLTKAILFDYFDGKSSSIQRKMIEEWLENPDHKEMYFQYLDEWEQAHPQYRFDPEAGYAKVLQHLNGSPAAPNPAEQPAVFSLPGFSVYRWGKWAAAAILILAGSWFGWHQLKQPRPITYEKLVRLTKKSTGEIYEKENGTAAPMLINLPDKSSVILQPNSKLCYSPRQYNTLSREVILSGEAFFEVQKNPNKPFLVYANGLITKVLGTSFSVKSRPTSTHMEVIVKTGKVAVFLQRDADKAQKLSDHYLTGLVLNANERVNVTGSDLIIGKPSRINPDELTASVQKLSFNFDETPATEVLTELEKAYGIDIIFDTAKLSNCRLTAHLSDEPLLEKLDLICAALGATYTQEDNIIRFDTKGCL